MIAEFKEVDSPVIGLYYTHNVSQVPIKINYFVDYGLSIHFNGDIIGHKIEKLKYYKLLKLVNKF